ncbi:hypothetical protein N7495_005967 [Penicillium taxi]|uniref:uncharacterized protein n=1 Tax=Penicillium taxi TaxID=168475 RepID=UPI0025459D12|nr:uncharacterized protein N7495_005967 [Penicillium taxi]KAJ5894276.1 hypothetical protein N7495_005967 [Penicillium taxi]
MFSGSSPPKDRSDPTPVPGFDTSPLSLHPENASPRDKRFSPPSSLPGSGFFRRQTEDLAPIGEKKRRSSTVTKAASFFNSAKNSLSLSSSRDSSTFSTSPSIVESPLERLGKMDPALSVPQGSLNNSAGESIPTSRSSFRVGVTEDRNRKCRRTMEDTHAYLYNFLGTPSPNSHPEIHGNDPPNESQKSHDLSNIVETDNGYFAIFDGHAGTFAAEWCGKKLHLILEDIMRRNPNTPVPELLDQTFTSVDHQLEKLPVKNSGCTAVTAVLRWEDRVPNSHSATGSAALAPDVASKGDTNSENTETPTQEAPGSFSKLQEKALRQRVLYTANVGDARIVLCRNGKALRLSYDHKGSDENEGKRIANAGGLILNNRVNGVLAVTRALGDTYLKDLVTGHPYTTETVIQPSADEFIILACDGLWDVCSDQEAVDLIRNEQDAQHASRILVDYALARFSTDNLSIMVIRLDSARLQDVINNKAELIGVDGDPSTNLALGVSEADKIVEVARQRMASTELDDNFTDSERKNDNLHKTTSISDTGFEISFDDSSDLPSRELGSKNGS